MSQDDQRHQPNEEPAGRESDASRDERDEAAAGRGEGAGATAAGEGDRGAAPAAGTAVATDATKATAATRPAPLPRREYHERGEGAPRYAGVGEEAPPPGSEDSWSAWPNPGYQADPRARASTKRLLTTTVVGLVVLGAGSFLGYSLLTAKSSNGNGAAPWTAAVEQNGAVVGGINAQNNGSAPAVALPADVSYGNSGVANSNAINQAVSSCRSAQATTVPVTTATGTAAAIHDWAAVATPVVQKLRTDAAALQTALANGNVAAVAGAAATLCSNYAAIGGLPAMPDSTGSQAWSAAVTAYADAATQSIRGVSGTISGKPQAMDSIAAGDSALDALSSRIATAP